MASSSLCGTPQLLRSMWLSDTPNSSLTLLAGQVYFGRQVKEIKTLLGSCVGLVFWNDAQKLGGMCHCLLPERVRPQDAPLDARYVDEALPLLVDAMREAGTQPSDYAAWLFGGADLLSHITGVQLQVGARNVAKSRLLLGQYGFRLVASAVGESCPRHVTLTVQNGSVSNKRGIQMQTTLAVEGATRETALRAGAQRLEVAALRG